MRRARAAARRPRRGTTTRRGTRTRTAGRAAGGRGSPPAGRGRTFRLGGSCSSTGPSRPASRSGSSAREEVLERLAGAFLQPVPVGDRLVRLDREQEPGRRGLDPRRHRLLRRHVAEGVVDLHAVQPAGVVPEEPRRRQVLRIEVGLPRRVRIARCPCIERRHRSSCRSLGSRSDGRRAEEGPAAPPVCIAPARWRAGQTPPPSLARAAAPRQLWARVAGATRGKATRRCGGRITHQRRHDNRGDRR